MSKKSSIPKNSCRSTHVAWTPGFRWFSAQALIMLVKNSRLSPNRS